MCISYSIFCTWLWGSLLAQDVPLLTAFTDIAGLQVLMVQVSMKLPSTQVTAHAHDTLP